MTAEENLIKATCKELNLTYKQLGELIGYGEGAIKNSASTGNVSEPMRKAIELYKETLNLKKELDKLESLKIILKELVK